MKVERNIRGVSQCRNDANQNDISRSTRESNHIVCMPNFKAKRGKAGAGMEAAAEAEDGPGMRSRLRGSSSSGQVRVSALPLPLPCVALARSRGWRGIAMIPGLSALCMVLAVSGMNWGGTCMQLDRQCLMTSSEAAASNSKLPKGLKYVPMQTLRKSSRPSSSQPRH